MFQKYLVEITRINAAGGCHVAEGDTELRAARLLGAPLAVVSNRRLGALELRHKDGVRRRVVFGNLAILVSGKIGHNGRMVHPQSSLHQGHGLGSPGLLLEVAQIHVRGVSAHEHLGLHAIWPYRVASAAVHQDKVVGEGIKRSGLFCFGE